MCYVFKGMKTCLLTQVIITTLWPFCSKMTNFRSWQFLFPFCHFENLKKFVEMWLLPQLDLGLTIWASESVRFLERFGTVAVGTRTETHSRSYIGFLQSWSNFSTHKEIVVIIYRTKSYWKENLNIL